MKRIIFFDGICLLCNNLVDWSRPSFSQGEIYYAPLQGETAKSLLNTQDLGLNTVIYFRDNMIYQKSDAIMWLFFDMKKMFLYTVTKSCPKFFRDMIYDIVAKNRYWIFGKTDFCRLPNQEEKLFFLP